MSLKRRFYVGDFRVTLAKTGEFSLDAGMVYGAIPKTLWGRIDTVDELNRVRLSINVLFLDNGNFRILIDSGAGSLGKYDDKLIEIWNLESEEPDEVLGLDENDVDLVILTHLHFDHVGGLTRSGDGVYQPVFKRAIHYIHEEEYKAALNPTIFEKFSYFERDFKPLVKANLVRFIKGKSGSIENHFRFFLTKGHTLGHIAIRFVSQSQTLIHPGDLILTSNHAPLPWISGIDLCKLESLEAKKTLYEDAVGKDHLFVFPHDKKLEIGKIVLDNRGRYKLEKV